MKNRIALLVAFALCFASLSSLGFSWANSTFERCNNIQITSATNGTWFIEVHNGTVDFSEMAANKADGRFVNGTCSDSGGPLNYFREYSNSTVIYYFVNLSGTTTQNISFIYKNNTAITDDSGYAHVFYNDADVTFATSTGWTAVGAGVAVDTANKYISVASASAAANGVYGALKGNQAPINYSIYYRASYNPITSQGGGPGLTNSTTEACYNSKNSFCGIAYNGAHYYLEGNAGGTSLETDLSYSSAGVEHYGRLAKNGSTFNLTLSSARNGSVVLAQTTKTAGAWADSETDYFWPFITFATGYGSNTISGWVNQTYLTDYKTPEPNFTMGATVYPAALVIVTLTNPANTTVTANYTDKLVFLNYTVTGNESSYSCNETLDGTLWNTSTASNNTAVLKYFPVTTYGGHNFSLSCNNSATTGTAAVAFSVAFTSNLTIYSSGGFSLISGAATTLSCTANGIIPLLYKDGVNIPQNYTFAPGNGVYNISCGFNATSEPFYSPNTTSSYLIVSGGQYGCYNTSTFAYRQNISGVTSYPINLNFTSLIASNTVRADLGDVWVHNGGTFNITVNGSLLVVLNNSATSSFTVDFGNYPINNNYLNGSAGASTLNMTNYSDIGSHYKITVYEEKASNASALPPYANTTLSLICTNGTSDFRIMNATVTVAVNSNVSQIRTFVVYNVSDLYYRDRMITSPIADVYIYLTDASRYQVVQTNFKIDDRTGNFGTGSIIRIKRILDGSLKTVTELPSDIEQKAITYLVNGDKYQFYIDSSDGLETRALGDIYADSSALTKTVTIMPVIAQNMSDYNTSFTAPYMINGSGGVISFVWSDQGNKTNLVEMWIYNMSDGHLLAYMSSTNRSYVAFVYNTTDENGNYTVPWKIASDTYGNHTIAMTSIILAAFVPVLVNPIMVLITALGGGIEWFVMIFIVPISMVLPRRYIGISAMLMVGVVAMFKFLFTTFPIDWRIIGICLLVAIAIEADEARRRR